MFFVSKNSTKLDFNDFVFTAIEVNDTYNAKVLGQSQSYCWDDVCEFPKVKGINI